MTKPEVKSKLDEIVAFAEVEKFIDTPVKRYSSGMYVRLAFAVAAHLDPEILIVDEVLAVGDAQFQKKCIGKMSEVAGGGRTVLFVSHNMQAIRQLCQECIWLETGRLRQKSLTSEIVQSYLTEEHSAEKTVVVLPTTDNDEPVHLAGARLLANDEQGTTFYNGSQITFEAAVRLRRLVDLSFCMPVFREGEMVFLANSYHKCSEFTFDKPGTSPNSVYDPAASAESRFPYCGVLCG